MLTDTKIKTAKAQEKAYRLADSEGLFIHVMPTGKKFWRMRYRASSGKEQTLTFGPYPAVSLRDARAMRDSAKDMMRHGIDPSQAGKLSPVLAASREEDSFETVAREWYALRRDLWRPRHAHDVIHSLERDVFPLIGKLPPAQINARVVLHVLNQIEERGAIETAHRVRQRMSDVFVHAIATGRADNDPATVVKAALRPVQHGRQPAITDLAQAREMIAKVEGSPAHPVTLLALRLLYLTAVRPGEIRGALWEEFHDLDGPEPLWIIPAERMKMGRDHIVPLSPQAVEVVQAVRPFSERWAHLFPNARRPRVPMCENALGYLLNRAGYHGRHVPHGFRSTFSSVMNERHPQDHAVIELMLAHVSRDKVAGAYNRALHLSRRRELSRIWMELILEGQVDTKTLVSGRRKPMAG
ncbi:integrase arm-type DNA-binding domain-containing protein [Acetobacter sp. TBRC 12305]|uniref:Integrase arm-type DNA-binding domain-containing protein n=1 Tax=Acetobacter garciniae TaxID=2817435 RepID=A0A939HIX3_9PROT|nr:integrase arm-type DNA-binding domain-containing protein [Acetobacter garciniae]MBO1325273.1 integrase arm-type DNA-binding domain-containing protein [Acetobacter garciniae]MBX0344755.1 integrase arm-type DNA-binding domain-containing protein [Acetobacter garciniae]